MRCSCISNDSQKIEIMGFEKYETRINYYISINWVVPERGIEPPTY